MQYSILFNLNRPINVEIVEFYISFLDLSKITWNLWCFLPFVKKIPPNANVRIRSKKARRDISRAGIINCFLALLRALLERGYYSREDLIWGNTVSCTFSKLYVYIQNCIKTSNFKLKFKHIFHSKYKDYKGYIKDWTIEARTDANASAYWQYIFGKFETDITEEYACKSNPKTPSGWKNLTKEEALASLKDYK